MVSSLTSVFRSRSQQDKKDKKEKKGTVSTSSEEQPVQPIPSPVAMVLVPTVTIQEVTKEVQISLEPVEVVPSSSVQIQEIEVLTPNEDEVKTETEEPCALCANVVNYVKPYYENLKAKAQQLIDRVMDPSLHATIKSEFFLYLPSILIAFAFFFFAITFVSFVKLLSHGVHNEPSFFCRYFSGPFSPMFDALCAPEPFVFSDELPRVMSGLIDEIMLTISEFFHTVAKGFSVFGTLFTAISHGLSENVFFGFHELGENLGENIHHLIHFIVQFFHQIIHLFFSSIATIAGGIAGVFTSIHDYFEPKPTIW